MLYILTYYVYNFLVLTFVMIPFFVIFFIWCIFKLGFNIILLLSYFLCINHNNPYNPDSQNVKTYIDYYLEIMSFLKELYLKIKNKIFP